MTRNPIVCGAEDSLDTAASRMRDGDCGCLPVVDDAGRVVGMVTDRDICMAALASDSPLSEVRVAQAMTRPAATSRPLDSLEDAERTMRQHRVRRLPVVDDQARIVGVLSCHDLFRNAAANGDDSLRRPRATQHEAVRLVATMVAIGRSRRARGPAERVPAPERGSSCASAPTIARIAHASVRLASRGAPGPLVVDATTTFHLEPSPRR